MAIEDFDQVTIAPAKLRPFSKFIMSIGELPTSYLDSLSYAEQITWFCDYLQNNVIPALNNNAEALEEVQGLMTQLQEYVDNYFTNLDVQEEINKKLDEMAEDGTLSGLISTYLVPIINEQNRQINTINDKVEVLASGSPKGTYATVEDLETADPDHDYIYIVTATGNWYYYNTTESEWTSGGTYQASQSTDDVLEIKSILESVYNVEAIKGTIVEYENKAISTTTGAISSSNARLLSKDYLPTGIQKIEIASGYVVVLVVYDSSDEYKGIFRTGTHTIEKTSSLNWTATSLTVPYDLLSTGDKLKLLMRSGSGTSVAIEPSEANNLSYTYKLLNALSNKQTETELSNLYDYTGLTPISFDETFTHDNPINIYKVDDEYTTSFDPLDNKLNASNPVYIAPDGNDTTGNGTENNPYLTLEEALSVEDVDTIYLKHGIYYLGTNFTNGLIINKEINLIGDNATIYFGDISTGLLNEAGIMRIRKGIYCEGITFNGGRGLVVEVTTDLPTFNNCKFINSNQNGLNFRGLGCYLYNCEAYNNDLDGFNYHSYNDVYPIGVVEVKCKAHHNGNITNRSSNGSTIHENGRIIRLKCEYYLNHGGNLADSESMSYNFDIKAYNSMNYSDIHYNANYQALTNSKIWLYNCMGGGSVYELSAITSSIINTDNNVNSNYIYHDTNSSINIFIMILTQV